MEPDFLDVLDVLRARHCKRAFLDRPVPREVLEEVLSAAANAPSTRNSQPWRVAVLTGAAREELARKLCDAFDRGVPVRHDYSNRPPSEGSVEEARARAAGAGVFAAKGIERADEAARRAHLRDNQRFYGAPVELIFHLPADAPPGIFLEMGFFVQNVMLGLVARGLGSCPQYSVTAYSDIIREYLGREYLGREHSGFGPDRLIVCGMAVGYPDPGAPVNAFVPERAPLADYVQWFDGSSPCSDSDD